MMHIDKKKGASQKENLDILQNNAPLQAILKFLESALVEFPVVIIQEGKQNVTNEQGLTQELFDNLNKLLPETWLPAYYFDKEVVEDTTSGQSPRIDLAIKARATKTVLLHIEAKCLPTPGTGRKREYVIGDKKQNGGIERFKRNRHARGCSHACMIGYVQKGSFDEWLEMINGWIGEVQQESWHKLEWSDDEILRWECGKSNHGEPVVARLCSKHKKCDCSAIGLTPLNIHNYLW